MASAPDLRIVIVGAGFGGIGCAIELGRHGFGDVTILERGDAIGGTWLHNTYPGAACDVPSHLYSYSFAQRRDWSRLCSPQPEILEYLQGVARSHGVDRRVVTGVEVTSCAWDAAAATWTVSAADGRTWEADALVIATGQLHRTATPRIEGRDSFSGPVFHSAEWDHSVDLQGRRVAVVGTGASAVQFVPEVAERAGRTTVFQRSGNWFMPRRNRDYPPAVAWAIEHIPGVQAFRRGFIFRYGEFLTLMIRHPRTWGRLGALRSSAFMRWQLRGHPELRRKIWPDYTFGCKRVLFSSMWLPALAREDVDVVTDPITAITPTGVRTADGREHDADVLIWGTGFRTTDFMFPMEISGRGGESLRERWADGAHAHLGIAVPGFPSLFLMYGPNTNTSGGSIVTYLEAQAGWIRQALQHVRRGGAAAIEIRPEVEERSDREVQERFAGTAWLRCDSWYRDDGGRIVTNWPGFMSEYVEATRVLHPADVELIEYPHRTPSPDAGAILTS